LRTVLDAFEQWCSTQLSKRRRKQKPASSRRRVSHSFANEPPGEGDKDEAARFIAETAASLAALAQRHGLEHLRYLLAVAMLEAEEHLRLRSRRKLS
jgi:hypothetical protein